MVMADQQFALTESGADVEDLKQEDSWNVVAAYFNEKGLVRQQLDSFNQFIRHNIQSIVSCRPVELELQEQYKPGTLPSQQKVCLL